MSAALTILHVSDLHYDASKEFDCKIVIDALLKDVRSHRAAGIEFDAVVFSGDLVQAGDSAESFVKVGPTFIHPLLAAAGLSSDRLIIAPGNHDVCKSRVVPYVELGLRDQLKTVSAINEFIDGAIAKPSISTQAALDRMAAYEDYYRALGIQDHKSDNVFFKTKTISINGLKIGFAAFNSAWRATGDKTDKNFLIVGERAVDMAVADLSTCDLRICAVHHPFDWLLDDDAVAIEDRLFTAFDLLCVGHTHRQYPQHRISPAGSAVISQSGALYASRKYFNGYQIVTWDETNRKVLFQCRTYFDSPRRLFAPTESIGPGGRYEVQLQPREDQPHLSEIELFLRQGRPAIRAAADEHISFGRPKGEGRRDDISEAFVCPPLSVQARSESLIKGEDEFQRKQRDISAEALLRDNRNVALIGSTETGRTSLLHYFAVRVSEGVCDQPRIPAIVNAPLCVKEKNYEKSLRAYYSEANLKPLELYGATKSLPWIVFLDDFNGDLESHAELVRNIVAKHPLHRIIAINSTRASAKALDDLLGVPALRIEMDFLSRKNIRQLSRVRFSGKLDTGLEDPAYQLVMKHLNEARLPRTGYMVALLLWAAEQNSLGQNLNEAVLLENLVSFLLGKTNFEAALRNQFDPRAQEILLRAIAIKLKSTGGWIESNTLLEFIINYFKERGLGHGAREVLDEFIACRLLVEQDGYIAFRYSCYQEYFVALDLRQDNARFQSLLASSPDTILSYARELDLWSSLSREMKGVDQALLRVLETADLKITDNMRDLGAIGFTGHEIAFSRARVAQLLENPPTKDQIDEILDEADKARTRTTRRPPKAEKELVAKSTNDAREHMGEDIAASIQKIATQRAALDVLTRVVRNGDHEKLDVKKDSARAVLRLWSEHSYLMILLVMALLDKVSQSNSFSDSKLTPDDMERLTNILKMIFSMFDARNVASTLTSESLRSPIQEIALAEDVPDGLRFFAAIAYSETWDKNGIELMRKALGLLNNNVLRRAVLEKMLYDYRMQRYQVSSVSAFRELIAETEIFVAGASRNRKGQRIASLIALEGADEI